MASTWNISSTSYTRHIKSRPIHESHHKWLVSTSDINVPPPICCYIINDWLLNQASRVNWYTSHILNEWISIKASPICHIINKWLVRQSTYTRATSQMNGFYINQSFTWDNIYTSHIINECVLYQGSTYLSHIINKWLIIRPIYESHHKWMASSSESKSTYKFAS